jgi:hypothetical protein
LSECDDLGDELFGRRLGGRGRHGGDGVLDVVDVASGRVDKEVFGEGAGYAAGGCEAERSASCFPTARSKREVIHRTHNAPANSGNFLHL